MAREGDAAAAAADAPPPPEAEPDGSDAGRSDEPAEGKGGADPPAEEPEPSGEAEGGSGPSGEEPLLAAPDDPPARDWA